MNAGLLNEKIKILAPFTTRTETGSEEIDYNLQHECRARVIVNGGNRNNENSDIFYTQNVQFQIRRFYIFNENCRVQWQGKMYRILSVIKDKMQQCTSINAELIND